jgi:putative oxidoreductase
MNATVALNPSAAASNRPVGATSIRSASAELGTTLLRVSLGVMWIAHALLKLFVYTLPGTAQFFTSVGIPGVLAYPVFTVELLGGLALVLGIYARQVSLALVPVMLTAASVHVPNGWVFSPPGGGGYNRVLLAIASIALWLLGEGAFALRRSAFFAPGARR